MDRDLVVALGVHSRITIDEGQARMYNISKIIVHPSHSIIVEYHSVS